MGSDLHGRRGKARDVFDESNKFDGVFPFLVSNKKARTFLYELFE